MKVHRTMNMRGFIVILILALSVFLIFHLMLRGTLNEKERQEKELQEELGLTYMFVSHDLSMVRHISHTVGVMYLGCLVEMAPVNELYSNMQHPYTKALMSAVQVADPKQARANKRILLEGDVPTPIDPPPGCRFKGRCRYATELCGQETPPLRDIGDGHFVACHNV